MLVARQVLTDASTIIEGLNEDVSPDSWRRQWVTVVALLRAVMHVLAKVDGKSGSAKKIVNAEWQNLKNTKPQPEIFWEFIEKERNSILKEYEWNSRRVVAVTPGTSRSAGGKDSQYLIRSGYFVGRRQVDVAKEAVGWLESYLHEIECQVPQP